MHDFRFVQTCAACPEQYDVYEGDDLVGYVRLRHGYLRADCHGEPIYDSVVKGDGCFYDEHERQWHMKCIKSAMAAYLDGKDEWTLPEEDEGLWYVGEQRGEDVSRWVVQLTDSEVAAINKFFSNEVHVVWEGAWCGHCDISSHGYATKEEAIAAAQKPFLEQ